ncbi:MAG: Gfo/Idh/MocA family oxidoreductase, partial [Promethearchaeota archaeon]
MNKGFTVIQVGLGPMGKLITSLLIKRKNIELKGVVDINPQIVGKKLSKFFDVEDELDLVIKSRLENIVLKEKVDVVIIATSSSLEKVARTIKQAVEAGSNVISICEELSYPFQIYPQLS